MDEQEKKRVFDPAKATETISTRTTEEIKIKLAQKAAEKRIPLGTLCEGIFCDYLKSLEKQTLTTQPINVNMEKLNETAEKPNEQILEQLKILTSQLSKPMVEINNHVLPEKEKTTDESQNVILPENVIEQSHESLIEKIALVVPEKEREKFIARFKKMQEYRMKSGKDKSQSETIYNCIKYCIQWGAFFDAG